MAGLHKGQGLARSLVPPAERPTSVTGTNQEVLQTEWMVALKPGIA